MIAPASRRLGKYEIRHKLGRGGMADVYLAHDTETGDEIALKLIEHAADEDTRDSIEAERRGAELQARLADVDPRVVRIYNAGDLDGYFFVAMEYIDGQDLSDLLRRGPVMAEFAADTAIAVAETLNHAHELQATIGGKDFRGIVHGDIKPKNIRIDKRGEVRVLDFGIAKALSLSRRLTRNEFGSVPYSSPERLDRGEVSVDTDLWSLAVMLYEMVAGVQPYRAETTERLERSIRSRVAPQPPPEPCPEPLRRILIKALAPEPELRYPAACEFGADLAAFRAGQPVRAVMEDLEATRRSFRPEIDDETRRTARQDAAAEETRRSAGTPERTSKWPLARLRRPMSQPVRRAATAVLALSFGFVTWWVGSDYLTYRKGQQLQRDIETEQVTDLNTIWTRWTELSRGNHSSFLLRGPRKLVSQKLLAPAEHMIESYRNGNAVYVADWRVARDNFARALALDPGNTTRGMLRLAEGHVARISGTSRNTPDYQEAVEKFTEAQQLLPQSPDPLLGLGRVYVTGLKEIDKGHDALRQAEKLGYQIGNREKMQLADGYRDRGDRMVLDSRTVRGLPQEKNQIERAKNDYEHALELYLSLAPYGKASTNVVRVQKSLDTVNSRLQELEGGSAVNWLLRHIWR